jgi:DNA-binding response OmpR family regulator
MREEDEILLIEDDEDKAAIIMSILRQHLPGTIRHIYDGRAALDFLFSIDCRRTKLILLDLILPNVDGVEILRKIKSDPVLAQIPVMILSTSSQTEAYVEALGLHPDGYVHKPGRLQNCA